MSWVDAVILIVIGLSLIFGLWRGLVREVLSIIAWVAAIYVAMGYSDNLAPLFTNLIDSESVRYVVSFALLFIATLLLGGLINHLIAKLITVTGMRMADRLLGSMFGIARGVLIVMVFVFFAEPFFAEAPWWQQSQFVPYGVELVAWVQTFFADTPAVVT